MEKFNESLPFDRRMWAEDIRVRRVPPECRHAWLSELPLDIGAIAYVA